MASFYSILQYVSDPVKDERINVGVFAFDHNRCKFASTDDWSRVRCATGLESLSAVKEAIRDLRQWEEPDVRKFAESPFGNFHLTLPSASLLGPEDLLVFIARRVLPVKATKKIEYRVKSEVVVDVRRKFREQLKDRFGPAGAALLRDRERLIYSTKVPINPDVTIGNGHIQSIVQALSFEEKDQFKVQRDVSASGFIIQQVRNAQNQINNIPIGVVYVPPKSGDREMERYYDRVIGGFVDGGAELVEESRLADWAKAQVDRLRVEG